MTARNNAFWLRVRARRLPAHEFVGQTHCRACKAEANRRWMAASREKKKVEREGLKCL